MRKYNTLLILLLLLTTGGVACGQNTRETTDSMKPSSSSSCTPLETKPANAPAQKPAFPEQTRACGVASKTAFEVTVVAKGLDKPWAVEPLPNGNFLITEKTGQMRIVSAKGEIGKPIGGLLPIGSGGVTDASGKGGLPPITARGQGGLLDVALSPEF